MKNELTIEELKAICDLFFEAGSSKETDFESFFNTVMKGKYDKAIENTALQLKFNDMQKDIDKQMEGFDREERLRVAQCMKDLQEIIITA